LIGCGEQLIQEKDCANPKEKVATGQIKSLARFDSVRLGACDKCAHAQLRSSLIFAKVRLTDGPMGRNFSVKSINPTL
jgi:hypothetical protein